MCVLKEDPIHDVGAAYVGTGCACMVGLTWEVSDFIFLVLTVAET